MARILVLEDERPVSTVLAGVLSRAGHEVAITETIDDALASLRVTQVDLVLADLCLANNQTSLDVLRRMPTINKAARFVVLTGRGTVESCRTALLAGASDFIEKPIGARELIFRLKLASAGSLAPAVGASSTQRGNRHVATAVDLISRRFGELEMSTRLVAASLELSEEHLCRLFARNVGCTVMEYLHAVRVQHAAHLLRETKMPVYVIARECGYHSHNEIDLHFRRCYGCTPTQFREAKLVSRAQGVKARSI